MISYEDMTVTIGVNSGEISGFETWWLTPFGMVNDIVDAKTKLREEGIPLSILRPFTVAMCDNGLYEVIL